jgi:hypothetical protein
LAVAVTSFARFRLQIGAHALAQRLEEVAVDLVRPGIDERRLAALLFELAGEVHVQEHDADRADHRCRGDHDLVRLGGDAVSGARCDVVDESGDRLLGTHGADRIGQRDHAVGFATRRIDVEQDRADFAVLAGRADLRR